MYFHLTDHKGVVLHSTLPDVFYSKFEKCNSKNTLFFEDGIKYRHGKISNDKVGVAYILAKDPELVRRPRWFGETTNAFFQIISELKRMRKIFFDKANIQSARLVHDLENLTGHNIQEIYNLIPEEELRKQQKEKRKTYIQSKVTERIDQIHSMFLNLIKNHETMKMEFSVFYKLQEGTLQKLERQRHTLSKAFLSIAHSFFQEFAERDIYFNIDENETEVLMDYGLFQVGLYQIMDNAVKYARKSSDISVTFLEKDKKVQLAIEMSSLKIEKNELEKITQEKFCGRQAKKSKKNGKGLGMSRAKKALEATGIELAIEANPTGEEPIRIDGCSYTNNKFILSVPKPR